MLAEVDQVPVIDARPPDRFLVDPEAEVPDEVERIATWVEVLTGLALDDRGAVKVLDNAAWLARRERLESLGGPPDTGPRWAIDPILFGSDPTARAKVWAEHGRRAEAAAAYDEAARARPLDKAVALERDRFLDSTFPADPFTR